MVEATPPRIHRLEDYRPPAFRTTEVRLDFALDPGETHVTARSRLERTGEGPLVLYGRDLETRFFAIDGRVLDVDALPVEGEELRLDDVPDHFLLEVRTRLRPRANSTLMGLYETSGLLVTQCEAEGFRRITWFQDRPDVLARYRVRLEADRAAYPVLLSNGNPVERGTLPNGRHFAIWEDPHPKPSYLFALVAGRLAHLESRYRTASGREVTLRVHADPLAVERCRHALHALELAMRWDEAVYGLECDLDLFQIVAVEDFNFGAMENKGLNIFNASALLADPEIATDEDYLRILRIVAHEYFHNWTGNRVTLRDWFQLTLKEGLTVFRDQQFMEDVHSAGVSRIGEVARLRQLQWPEDTGPLAHPVRPRSYMEINNFYTATVYDKGAEVVRMLATLLGRERFIEGVRTYLRRMDGRAATVEDFLAAMAEVSKRDLSAFARWYDQAGLPVVRASADWDAATGRFVLELSQERPDGGEPLVIPVRTALLTETGSHLPLRLEGENRPAPEERVLEFDQGTRRFLFEGVDRPAWPSLLRGQSAPLRLESPLLPSDLAFLMARDDDPVSRWDAGQTLALLAMEESEEAGAGSRGEAEKALRSAWKRLLEDLPEDRALAARLLSLPDPVQYLERRAPADVDAALAAWTAVRNRLAAEFLPLWRMLYDGFAPQRGYRMDAESIGRRSLRNTVLDWLAAADAGEASKRVVRQYEEADNLTDRVGALRVACRQDLEPVGSLLERFHGSYRHEVLLLDRWFALQAIRQDEDACNRLRGLLRHPDFSWHHPNRVRALFGTFAGANPKVFHRRDGAGYALLAEAVLAADPVNPQIAARLARPLTRLRRFREPWSGQMRRQLERIAAREGLSRDTSEIVLRALSG